MIAVSAASALSPKERTDEAFDECVRTMRERLGPGPATFAVWFATTSHEAKIEKLGARFQEALGTAAVVGSGAWGVLTDAGEIEGRPGLAVLAVRAPGCPAEAVLSHRLGGDSDRAGFEIGRRAHALPDLAAAVVVADPSAFSADPFFREFHAQAGGVPVCGGLSSFIPSQPTCLQSAAGSARSEAVAACLVGGPLRTEFLVTHCCDPLGRPEYITDADGSTLLRLGRRKPVEVLSDLLGALPQAARNDAAQNLLGGLALDPAKRDLERGDYLIRSLVGVDTEAGSIRVAIPVGAGQRFCFQHRTKEVAERDFTQRLQDYAALRRGPPAFGLYFDCIGRGRTLYGEEGVDTEIIRRTLGSFPLVGFSTNGEIAGAGGRTLLHNYTGVLALFHSS